MTTITWRIGQLDRNATNGGVTTAHWNVTVVTDEHFVSTCGVTKFTPDHTAPDFVPYANLSEADVLGWVWKSVDKASVEATLNAEIEAQKAPATLNGLPW